jgi:hypothetical protein
VFEFSETGNDDKFDAVPELEDDATLPQASELARRSPRHRIRPAHDGVGMEPGVRIDHVPDARSEPELFGQSGERWPDLEDLSTGEPELIEADSFLDDELAESIAEPEWQSWERAIERERPVPEAQGLWANIPRCCRTCRDFRPAGNGERGWCNNQWAFKHRRMVDADDRPCETSIGHWWLPGDGAWQGDFDISAYGQPTPLMDRWFGRESGGEIAADSPAERRRRKASSW